MNKEKLMHKLGKRLEENYTWYQVEHIQGVLADVLSSITEDEYFEHELSHPPSKIKFIMVPNVDGSAVRYIREDLCEASDE